MHRLYERQKHLQLSSTNSGQCVFRYLGVFILVLIPCSELRFVLQHNCDPRFFTTVVFYTGSVSMATQLKFEVFDVYDRRESKVIVCACT